MAAVDILAAFAYKWAETGTVEALDDAQYKAGWAFIGATPPSVEQFNKVHQIADEKANYLYAQMLSVFTQAGEVPSPGDANSLRDALLALYDGGRILRVVRLTTSGTYTPGAGAQSGILLMVGGGAGSSGTNSASAGQVSLGGGGGGGGQLAHYFSTLPASQSYTIGAGGTAGPVGTAGGAGGSTIFGSLNASGGGSSAPFAGVAPPIIVLGGPGGIVSTGGNLLNLPGAPGETAVAVATGQLVSGAGAGTWFGIGGRPIGNTTALGNAGLGFGSAPSGSITGPSAAGQVGVAGQPGVIFIIEMG